jgi:hypothetical protein
MSPSVVMSAPEHRRNLERVLSAALLRGMTANMDNHENLAVGWHQLTGASTVHVSFFVIACRTLLGWRVFCF